MSTRLALRPDTYRVSVDNGVYLLGTDGAVLLSGASIAQWLDRLAPHLDGTRTLEELTAGLPPERRQMVESIVETLLSRGVVQERHDGESRELDEADATRHSREISFLEHYRSSATAAFDRYRSMQGVVVGDHKLHGKIITAALRSGLREACVVSTEYPRDLAGAQFVIQVCDGSEWTKASRLEHWCAREHVPLAQAVLSGGTAWLVPLSTSPGQHWSAVRPRLHARSSDGGAGDMSPAAATVVASRLVHAVFRTVTGVSPDDPPNTVVRVDLGALHSERHRFLPHPFALPAQADSAAGFRNRISDLAAGASLVEEEFSRRAAACVDDRLGIIRLEEHDWVQRPLHVTEAAAYPAGPPVGQAIRTIRAGLTYQAARVAATMRAMADYGVSTVDPRRLVDASGSPLVDPDGDPHSALARLRAGTLHGAAWAYELAYPGRVRRVPAAAAFAGLRPAATAATATAGLGAGLDWEQAVMAGLLGRCRQHTLMEAQAATDPFPLVDPNAFDLDETGDRCRALLATLDDLPVVYDVTGKLGVPTFAFCVGQDTVSYATGETSASAMSQGLVDVVRYVQARSHGQPAYLPPEVPDLPPALRGRTGVSPDTDRQPWDVRGLSGRLREEGLIAAAVPLDHDPGLAAVLPYLVQVVIAQ